MPNRGRRGFLRDTGAACGAMPLVQLLGAAQALQQGALSDSDVDYETLEFWTRSVRTTGGSSAAAPGGPGIGVRSRAQDPRGPQVAPLLSSRLVNEPVFFYYSSEKGFQRGHLLAPDPLPARGDLDAGIQILECRPSITAYEKFSLETSSMRVDLQQGQAHPNLPEPLAWSALAALLPDSKSAGSKMGSTLNLAKAWGRSQRIALPGGFGAWTWNFFLKEKDSLWTQVMRFMHSALGPVTEAAPIIGLPAIGKTALRQIDAVLGRVQAQKSSKWVFQSRDVEIYGTRDAADRVGPRAVQLRSGEYLMIPTSYADRFEDQMGRFKLLDGKLVPTSSGTGQLNRTAEETLPDLSYMTLHVSARPKESCKCPSA